MAEIPQKAAGTRILPAKSLPIPNGDPPAAMRQPSPPDDPPGVGLMEEIPQKAAGTRALPPMSLPIPSGDPPAAMRHPSPPDDPPGVRSLLCGFIVKPQIGLLHPKLPNAKPN